MSSPTFLQRLVREPLVHFILLGGLVFAADYTIAGRKNDPHVIEMGPEVDKEARTIFRDAQGREPTEAELKVLRDRWLDNEVLYREGVALGLDQGDATIRERMIFKALNVMGSNLALPKVDGKVLQDWYEKRRGRYDEASRVNFHEAVLVGDRSDKAVVEFVEAINSGKQTDAQSGLRSYKDRPRPSIVTSFGDEFTSALEKLPPGKWTALKGKDGVHVVRVESVVAGRAVPYDEVRAKVYADWKDETLQEMRTAAVRDLGKKYKVVNVGESK